MMKMYILLKDSLPKDYAPVVAAHASLACYLKFKHDGDMQHWLNTSFRKVVCSVTEQEFTNAKMLVDKNFVLTESSLGGIEVGVVFCPRKEYHKMFNYFKLWKV